MLSVVGLDQDENSDQRRTKSWLRLIPKVAEWLCKSFELIMSLFGKLDVCVALQTKANVKFLLRCVFVCEEFGF